MKSRMRLFKHPLHPMLVMFPVAIFPLLLFLDLVQWRTGASGLWEAGFWLALAGLVTSLAAIVPGVADMRPLRDGTREHRVGLVHAVVGTLILIAFAVGTWLRFARGPDALGLALALDAAGSLLVTVQGWLGGELVYHHHVGVASTAEGGEPARPAEAPAAGLAREEMDPRAE